jgi:hypothetical protein
MAKAIVTESRGQPYRRLAKYSTAKVCGAMMQAQRTYSTTLIPMSCVWGSLLTTWQACLSAVAGLQLTLKLADKEPEDMPVEWPSVMQQQLRPWWVQACTCAQVSRSLAILLSAALYMQSWLLRVAQPLTSADLLCLCAVLCCAARCVQHARRVLPGCHPPSWMCDGVCGPVDLYHCTSYGRHQGRQVSAGCTGSGYVQCAQAMQGR